MVKVYRSKEWPDAHIGKPMNVDLGSSSLIKRVKFVYINNWRCAWVIAPSNSIPDSSQDPSHAVINVPITKLQDWHHDSFDNKDTVKLDYLPLSERDTILGD